MSRIQDDRIRAAFRSFLFSVSLWFGLIGTANKDARLFVGLWVPSILSTGLYHGSRAEKR